MTRTLTAKQEQAPQQLTSAGDGVPRGTLTP